MLIKMLKSGDVVEVSAERLAQLDASEYVLVTVSASSVSKTIYATTTPSGIAKTTPSGIAKTTILPDPVLRRKPK